MSSSSPIDLIETVAVKARIPSMVIGAPGTGKTAAIRALAERLGYGVVLLVASQMDPTDFNGMPQGRELGTTSNGKKIFGTVYLSPVWQVRVLKERKVIVFLDEYSNAPASIRAGFLTLIQDREFSNGQKLPEETIVIGGMNPPDEAADGTELDLPTKNRFFHISWDPPAEEWFEGMLVNWGKETSDSEKKWRAKIVAFLRDNPGYLHKLPDESQTYSRVFAPTPSDVEALKSAWPSRRSWDNVAVALGVAENSVYTQDRITKGLVGFDASGEFRNWLRKHDVVNPHDALEDPASVNWKSLSIDDTNLLIRSIVELASSKNALQVIALFNHIADIRGSIAGPHVPQVIRKISSADKTVKGALLDMTKRYQSISKNA